MSWGGGGGSLLRKQTPCSKTHGVMCYSMEITVGRATDTGPPSQKWFPLQSITRIVVPRRKQYIAIQGLYYYWSDEHTTPQPMKPYRLQAYIISYMPTLPCKVGVGQISTPISRERKKLIPQIRARILLGNDRLERGGMEATGRNDRQILNKWRARQHNSLATRDDSH